jgi:hypothetical protein
VRERFSRTELYREVFGAPKPQASGPPPHERGDFERTCRVWHEKPDCWRQEAELPDGTGIEYRIIDGRSFWSYSPHEGAHAATTEGQFGSEFEIAYVFDPKSGAPDLTNLQMRVVGHIRHAGREALTGWRPRSRGVGDRA